MSMKVRKMTAIALGIGAMVLAVGVNAGSHAAGMASKEAQNVNPPAAEQVAPEPYLTEQEIAEALESQGYTEITKIELEKGKYEVKARDADGRRIELYADPRTGEILKTEYDD